MSVKSFRQVDVALKTDEVAARTAVASTLGELIATIPRAYQAGLGDHLTKKYRAAQKHANVQSTVSLYERHLTEHSFPPLIRNALKEPKLQFAKEFLGTTGGHAAPDVFKEKVKAARTDVLKCALAQKQSELALLSTLTKADVQTWQSIADATWTRIEQSSGIVAKQGANGKWTISNGPETIVEEYSTVRAACETYTYRVLAIARAANDRAEIQKIAKMQLKDTTDVEMTDLPKEPAVRELIREELKAALRAELSRANGKQRSPPGRVQKKPTGQKKGGKNNQKKKGKKSR